MSKPRVFCRRVEIGPIDEERDLNSGGHLCFRVGISSGKKNASLETEDEKRKFIVA